jgi:serine/threonine protein kinase
LLLIGAGAALDAIDADYTMAALDFADKRSGLADVAAAIRARGGRTAAQLLLKAPSLQPSAAAVAIAPSAPRALSSASELSWSSLVPDETQAPQRGGMGTVFKARWARRGVDVAVKLLRVSELSAAEFAAAAAALLREAELLRLASDAGANRFVVAQHGVARGPPTPSWATSLGDELVYFRSRSSSGGGGGGGGGGGAAAGAAAATPGELLGLVMAWQSGGTLADRLHRDAPWAARTAERLLLLERVAEGVALLHTAHPQLVVHGDIKSDNVLLTAEGEPRLIDFGIGLILIILELATRIIAQHPSKSFNLKKLFRTISFTPSNASASRFRLPDESDRG